jgi:hypothetical protein
VGIKIVTAVVFWVIGTLGCFGIQTTTFAALFATAGIGIGANKVISGNHLVYLNAGYESALSTLYQAGYVKGGYTYRF